VIPKRFMVYLSYFLDSTQRCTFYIIIDFIFFVYIVHQCRKLLIRVSICRMCEYNRRFIAITVLQIVILPTSKVLMKTRLNQYQSPIQSCRSWQSLNLFYLSREVTAYEIEPVPADFNQYHKLTHVFLTVQYSTVIKQFCLKYKQYTCETEQK